MDVDGKAEALGHYETALGDFRKVTALAERLAAVTADDVARVVRAYLRPERRTIVIAEPELLDTTATTATRTAAMTVTTATTASGEHGRHGGGAERDAREPEPTRR